MVARADFGALQTALRRGRKSQAAFQVDLEAGRITRIPGTAVFPAGKRRSALAMVVEDMLAEDFTGRILPFDMTARVSIII
jgi:hypothetical protein